MPWIRTVKPALFRHEQLFELEQSSKLPLRVAFMGLFTCSDREGRFEWKPRQLKLDVLPWDRCDFELVLNALKEAGFIEKYEVADRQFGMIPNWKKHQVISSKEAVSRIPAPRPTGTPGELPGNSSGATGVEGKGREEEGKGKENREEGKGSGEGKEFLSELRKAQARLEEKRMATGLNADGTQRGDWNEVRA